MEHKKRRLSPLAEAEREVWKEGREWMRRRLVEKLQALADGQGGIFPPGVLGSGAPSATPDSSEDNNGRGGD